MISWQGGEQNELVIGAVSSEVHRGLVMLCVPQTQHFTSLNKVFVPVQLLEAEGCDAVISAELSFECVVVFHCHSLSLSFSVSRFLSPKTQGFLEKRGLC